MEGSSKEESRSEVYWDGGHAKLLEQLEDGLFLGVDDHTLLVNVQSVERQPVGGVQVVCRINKEHRTIKFQGKGDRRMKDR